MSHLPARCRAATVLSVSSSLAPLDSPSTYRLDNPMANSPIRRIVPLTTWHRTHEEIVVLLAVSNAQRAMRGKASPVAAKVLERLESAGV